METQQPAVNTSKSEASPIKKSKSPKVLLMVGLGLVVLGIIQAVFIGGLNFFIFPGAGLMLIAALMPGKKVQSISAKPKSGSDKGPVEGEVVEEKK